MSDRETDIWTRDYLAAAFPVTTRCIYANHASMSPWPRDTQRAVEAFALENAERGPLKYAQWLKTETRLRQRIARMLNAPDAADIALLGNTSDGVNILAAGLDWQAGDNIVTPEAEFITNQLAWEQLADRGVELRRVDMRGSVDAEEALLDRMDERTRLLTVSAVQWEDGFRLDLATLGAACRDLDAVFFVDAIQQFGALPIDVEAWGIDCLAAGSHKWQMGPEGMGIFYCSRALRTKLRLSQWGWRMLDDPFHFGRAGRRPSATARRFETGSPNTMGQIALDASLAVLERFGQEAVAERVLANSRALAIGIGAMPGTALISDTSDRRLSGIISFMPPGDPHRVYRSLKERRVLSTLRGSAIRLSPHFYQHGEQIEDLLGAISESIK